MDYSILSSWPQNQSIDNRVKLALLFIHLIMIFAILAPLISRLLSRVGNERLNKFIALQKSDKNITYIDLYDFLSGLALSAFFTCPSYFFTMKEVYEVTGWVISGIYVFLMFISAISIASLSLMRFIWLFVKYNKYTYSVVAYFIE